MTSAADQALTQALAAQQHGRWAEAVAAYDAALAHNPTLTDAHYNRAIALKQLGRFEDAVAGYTRVLALSPQYADAAFNRGNLFRALGRWADALDSYRTAFAAEPAYAAAYANFGAVARDLKRLDEALAHLDRAIALRPDYAEAHLNRGVTLQDMNRLSDALACFDRAIALKPMLAQAYVNRGTVRKDLKRPHDAIADWTTALRLDPAIPYVAGEVLNTRRALCVWDTDTADVAQMERAIAAQHRVMTPFGHLAVSHSPEHQHMCARLYARDTCTVTTPLAVQPQPAPKIKIAVISSDFYSHAVCHLAVEMFERLDRSRFELAAFSFGPPRDDDMRTRLKSAFDMFTDVAHISDETAARMIAHWGAHIALDLTGFTSASRTRILGYRPAPIQINYLGYAGTLGADFIDYIIADRHLIPPGEERFYTEKVVRLPETYQATQSQRAVSSQAITRADVGLPEHGFVFCCFNNTHKIAPEMFDVWMRVLTRVPGSVLWLFKESAEAAENLRREAARRGVAGERLVFAARADLPLHLKRHTCADLFLDTLPYNAHTTASDALWMGLPLITCRGATFAGRVATSLLHAVELPELVTDDLNAYEHLAVALATDTTRIRTLKKQLADRRTTAALFDCARYTRHLESAFTTMYRRWTEGRKPEGFDVSAANAPP